MVDGQPGEGIKEGEQLIDEPEVYLPYLIRLFGHGISR